MKNIKIILIGLILLFSGCIETVEIPTPIPTSHALTEISDLSMEIQFICFYDDSEEIQHNDIINLYFYNKYTDVKETTTVYTNVDYTVIEIYRLPKWDDKSSYFKWTSIFEDYDSCRLYNQYINYNVFRSVNNIVVVDKNDSYDVYDRYDAYTTSEYNCIKSDNNRSIQRTTGNTFSSMYTCIDNLLFIGDFMGYKQYYPDILDKYR